MKNLEIYLRYLLPIVVGVVLFTNSFIAHAFNEMYFDWLFFGIFLLVVLALFEINRLVINYLDKKNPTTKSLGKRFLLPFCLSFLVICFIGFALYIPIKTYEIQNGATDTISIYHIILTLSQLFFINAIASSFHQLRNFRNQWQTTAIKAEALEKENTKAQLTLLKNQISPHFLFNNFNTLNGLIQEDPTAASHFLAQLSNIYRNVLKFRAEEVIALEQELATLSAYIYMLKTRFGDSLQIDQNYLETTNPPYYIPPFTLQLLLENAVKHNGFDQANPLSISIQQIGDTIEISNNLAPLATPVMSTGMGLANIQKRFTLLSDTQIEITQTAATFQVRVPLLTINS